MQMVLPTFIRQCFYGFKKAVFGVLLLAGLGSVSPFSAFALDLSYSDKRLNLLKDIASESLNFAKSSVYPFDARPLIAFRFERTPIGAMVLKPNGLCVILVNTNRSAWSVWPQFSNMSMDEVFEFSVWHEIGHCYSKKVLPMQGYIAPGAGIESESFADVFGLAMMKAKYPEKNFEALRKSVIESRNGFEGFFTASHFTSPAIEKSQNVLGKVDAGFLKDQTEFLKELAKLGLIAPAREKTTP